MSQVIDTKVVEMQFDNSKFEKNIQTSLNSLKFLNKSIDEAGKNRNSLDELAKSSEELGFALENVNAKERIGINVLNLLSNAGVSAFNKISDAVAGFATNMAASLSGMQAMRDGFAEYELKMGSVQTILAGAKIIDPKTGKNLEDEAKRLEIVNQKLEELNTYSDKTIYSFKDMTSNIGKFTNAGVGLDDAVSAIQGVANVAAVSGANASEASRAMYNFAQALSSGYIKLIDWKSIENANMATVDFKQQLLDTAVALGTVTKKGKDYITTTTNAQGKVSEAFNATKMFNDSLAHQWMTTEVLTQTLKNYSTDVREMDAAQLEAYKNQLKSIGYTEKQIDGIIKLGEKAFNAATEVKTFSQMIDTLKESMGSQWAQTFEIIFGDFREAKALWTSLNNILDPLLTTVGKVRNELLKGWKEDGGRDLILKGFSNLKDAIVALVTPLKALWEAFTPNKEHTIGALVAISKAFEKLTAVVSKVAGVIGKILAVALKPIVFIGNTVGKIIIKLVGVIRTAFVKIRNFLKPVIEALNTFKNTIADAFNKQIIARIKSFKNTISTTFANMKSRIGNSEVVKKLTKALSDLRDIVQDLFGRAMKNAGSYASRFISYLGEIWDALKPLVSSAVTTVLKKLSDFILPKLRRAAELLVDRLKSLGELISKIDLKNSRFYKGLSELPEKIKSLSNNKTLKSMFNTIKNFGSEAVEFLSNKFKDLKVNLEAIHMPHGLSDLFSQIKDFIGNIFGKDSISAMAADTVSEIEKIAGGENGKKLTTFQNFLKELGDAFEWLRGAASKAKTVIEDFVTFVKNNTPKAIKGLYNFLAGDDQVLTMTDITDVIYDMAEAYSRLLEAFGLEKVGTAFSGTLNSISGAFGSLSVSINNFLKTSANESKTQAIKNFAIALGILVGSLYLLSKIPVKKLAAATLALGIVGKGLVEFFKQISSTDFSGMKIAGNLSIAALIVSIGIAMAGVAASIGMLVGALAIFPRVIKQYNNLGDEFRTGMDRVKEVLQEIGSYLESSLNGKYALRSSAALFVLVKTLRAMRKTILDFASEEMDGAMAMGLLKIKNVLKMLGDFLKEVKLVSGFNIGINFNTLGVAATIWALGDMLKKIVPVIKELGSTSDLAEIQQGMSVITQILWKLEEFLVEMVLLSGARFSKYSGATMKQWIGISLTLGVLGSTISSIVQSLSTMTALISSDAGSFEGALDALKSIFTRLSILMGVIGTAKPAAAGTLFALSISIAALTACVIALVPIAAANPGSLIGAVASVSGLMIALGLSLRLAGKAGGETKAGDIVKLVGMTLVLLTVVNAMRRLAKVGDPNSIMAAAAAVATAATFFAGAIAVISAVSVHPLAIAAMALLAAAIWGVVFAIHELKGASGQMQDGAKNIEDSAVAIGETAKTSLTDVFKDFDWSSIFGDIDLSKIFEKFDLKAALRTAIDTLTLSAGDFAQDMFNIGTNLIDGLSKALSDPANADRLKECMKTLGKAIVDGFKNFLGIASPSTVMIEQGGYIIDGLVQGLMQYPQKLAEWVEGIGKFIIDGIKGLFSGALELGGTLVQNIGEGIQNGKEFVSTKASEIGKAALSKLGKAKAWADKAGQSVDAFGQKLLAGKGPVSKAAGLMITGATSTIGTIQKIFGSAASNAASKFVSAIKSGASPAKAAAQAIVTGAKSAFSGIYNSFMTFGRNAAEGFKQGIHNMIASIAAKAAEMVRAAKNAAKREQNSNSPSKDFMEYGNWAAEGYAIGMTNNKSTRLIEANAQKMVDSAKRIAMANTFGMGNLALDSSPALKSLAYAMGEISDSIDDSVESQPVIRPVIDMSNVHRNASAINAMFGDRKISAGVSATRQAQEEFEVAMANRNDMLVAKAVSKLSSKLDYVADTMNSRSLNNYISIDGSTDPEAFADGLIRSFRLNARTV